MATGAILSCAIKTLRHVAGTPTGTFTVGETATQATSGATGVVVAAPATTVAGSLVLRDVTGTPDGTNTWTGGTSSATFAVTAAPVHFFSYAEVTVEGFTTGAAYAFGFGTGNAPGASTPYLTVVSEGYTGTVLGTTTRTVYLTQVLRKPYPAESSGSQGAGTTKDEASSGGNLVVRIALSEPVYTDDRNGGAGTSGTDPTLTAAAGWITNAGGASQASLAATALTCTNTSGLVYPKVIGQWDGIAGTRTADRVKADFTVATNLRHKFGIAAGRFDATGQTSAANANGTATTQTATQRSATGLYGTAHRATLAIAGFTQAELIDLRFRGYPVVGDASSVLDTDSFTTASDEPLGYVKATILCDKSNALDSIKYVSTTGNDSTGDGSVGNPYATIAKAVSVAGVNIVYLVAGSHSLGSALTRRTTSEWVVVQPAPGESASTVTVKLTSTRPYRCQRLQFKNVTVNLTDNTSYLDGEDVGNFLRWTGCAWSAGAITTPTTSPAYRSYCSYFENCTGDLGAGKWNLRNFGGVKMGSHLDGCEVGPITSNPIDVAYRVVACRNGSTTGCAFLDSPNVAGLPATDNFFFEFNRFLYCTQTGAGLLKLASVRPVSRGMSIIGNVIERTTTTSPAIEIGSPAANTQATEHVLLWHNTAAGERENLGYNETGSACVPHTNWSVKFNCLENFNNKDDTFPTAQPPRMGSWAVGYGQGFEGNYYEGCLFRGEFDGLRTPVPATATPWGDTLFTDDQSYNRTAATVGSGGGTYTLQSGSPARNRIAAGRVVLPYDQTGQAFDNLGGGSAGALQRAADVVPAAVAGGAFLNSSFGFALGL